MADRQLILLAAVSWAALGLMAPADAADMAATPAVAQPYVAPVPARGSGHDDRASRARQQPDRHADPAAAVAGDGRRGGASNRQ